jgi:hypothetical protein
MSAKENEVTPSADLDAVERAEFFALQKLRSAV